MFGGGKDCGGLMGILMVKGNGGVRNWGLMVVGFEFFRIGGGGFE